MQEDFAVSGRYVLLSPLLTLGQMDEAGLAHLLINGCSLASSACLEASKASR